MIAGLTNINKVSIVALSKKILGEEKVTTIADLAEKYEVPLTSEHRNRDLLINKLAVESSKSEKKEELPGYVKDIVTTLLRQSYAVQHNSQRLSFSLWFKALVEKIRLKYKVRYKDLEELLGISSETLMGFSTNKPIDQNKIDGLSKKISEIWNTTPPKNKKTIDDFRYFLDKKHGDLEISYHRLREILINLGFYRPRGPKIKNHGGVKKEFEPHTIWEGDGKQINISINGDRHPFCWYAFTDQNTTLIVGSNIEKTETAESFLNALKNGKNNSGLYSIGVLVDNRLSDSDLSSIKAFMKEHNIILIRTFPGNSKSNGIIENNFSIFDKFVGDINIQGKTSEEIAASIGKAIVEIFTQLRNNHPRKRLHGSTPNEKAENSKKPEHQRSAIKKMAKRLNREIIDIDTKWELIANARKYFEDLSEKAEIKLKGQLKYYDVKELIAAQATYISKVKSRPQDKFLSFYFMGILRNKQETLAKQVYNEEYRAGIEKAVITIPQNGISDKEYVEKIVEEIIEAQNKPSPTETFLHLDALSWVLIRLSDSLSLAKLWQKIQDAVTKTFSISFQFWQQVNEYITGKIGEKLYVEACK